MTNSISVGRFLFVVAAATLPVVSTALATAQWGGRFVSSLNHAGLLRTGIVATVQGVFGAVLGAILMVLVEGNSIEETFARNCICGISGNLIAGGIIYVILAVAVKAGLIATALTLPAVASLVILPAVVEGVTWGLVREYS